MDKTRLHDTLFAIIVGIVLGVTIWSLSMRAAGSIRFENKLTATTGQGSEEKTNPSTEGKTPSQTEMMIQKGELSGAPARFWSGDSTQGKEVQ